MIFLSEIGWIFAREECFLTGDLFGREVLSVTELTFRLKNLIEAEFGQVWLTGEISNMRVPGSGHFYLTLKDQTAQIRAVMFRTQQRYLDFVPEDGQEVMVRGQVSVYEPRGEYQIILDYMEPRGEGALRIAFEKLKAKLAEEGLFDEERKKPLPFLPKRVALVTSPTGAAVKDFIRAAQDRFENVTLSIYPVRVQGENAAGEIAQAVEDLNRWGGFDLIVLTRGGGSLEDLWPFNEERVARAVEASSIPVVSAVGHEIDFSISDFVADLRAPTPSSAAGLIFRDKKELKSYLNNLAQRITSAAGGRINLVKEMIGHNLTRLGDPRHLLTDRRLKLEDLSDSLTETMDLFLNNNEDHLLAVNHRLMVAHPGAQIGIFSTRLAGLKQRLGQAGPLRLTRSRDRLYLLLSRLGDLNPLAVLKRGYAVVRKPPDMSVLKSANQTAVGDRLNVGLAEGELNVTVNEVSV